MGIKKNFFAPLSSGLGATRRAAMLLLVMMLTTATAWAQSGSCGDHLTWRLTARTLTISGTGAMNDYNPDINPAPWNSYAEQINEVVIEKDVTSIGAYAFIGTGLTSVSFAAGSQLTSIGEYAFSGTALTSVEIPASVTSIGDYAFYFCSGLGSVTFAEGSQLTSIGDYAFAGSDLTSITIPASVTSIGENVFLNCFNLASMTVADGNTVYDSRNGCNAIIVKSTNTLIIGCNNSTIPASVTSIDNSAFYATGLTSIEIPAGVTSIGVRAFLNCSALATVTVYAPSCSLGEDAFANCNNLANIYVFSDLVDGYKSAWSDYTSIITGITGGYCGATGHETDVVWALTGESPNYTLTISGTGAMADYSDSSKQPWKDYRSSIKTVVIGAGVTSLGKYTFYGCTSLTSINIPASVTSIGNYTFSKCSGLTSIEIPASVTSIGDDAFWECSNLATVTFAEDSQLATIGISAFSECSGLTSIEIPASVTSIGDNAFHYCRVLATVSFAAGSQLTSIGDYAFEYCSGLTSIEIPASVTSIGVGAFANCSNLEAITVDGGNTVYDSRNGCNAIIEKSSNTLIAGCKNTTIPDGVTSIRVRAFYGCTGLTSINIPASVTSIGMRAFYGCTGLTSIDIPASVTSIGGSAFTNTGLTSIDIPAGVTSIGISAFQGCSGLTSIEIPAGVTSIDDYAFKNCSNLATVTVYAPSCSLGKYVFSECTKLENIYVFSDLVDDYKAAWSDYTSIITGITGGYCGTTDHETDVVWVLTGESTNYTLTISGTGAMADYDEGMNTAPWNSYAEQIYEVVIEDGVTSIGDYAFDDCSGLTDVEIPASVTSIGNYTFANCTGLTSIEIPASVTSIGRCAFLNCRNLATVTVYAPSCSLGEDAFDDCNNLANIYVFSDKVASYKAATNWKNYAGKITALPTVTTSYVDATGTLHEGVEAVPLNNAMTTLSAGWYVVNSDISYTGTITLNGDVNIILADGKTMSVVPTTAGFGIFGYNDINGESYDLTIYGQTGQSGTLAATTSGVAGPNGWDGTPGYAFYVGGYTQHGGIVTLNASGGIATCISAAADVTITRGTLTANTTGSDSYGISAIGKLTISDGSVTANATGDSYSYGIYVLNKDYWDGVKWVTVPATLTFSSGNVEASSIYMQEDHGGGTINLSWTNATDRFKVTEYVNGTVTIADGKAFHNGSEPLSGTVTDKTKLNGKTLTPPTYSVTANRATMEDTEYWSTFYHPAAGYTADENTTVYQAAVNTTTNKVELTAVPGREIPADKAVVLKSTQSAITLSRATTTQTLDGNELKGGSTVADGTVPYTLAAKGGTVGFYKFVGAALNPNKAHLEITAPAQSAPAFFGFEENTTAINEHELHESHELSGAWYTLDGRKLQGKPSAKGIYVRNGRKFIIK